MSQEPQAFEAVVRCRKVLTNKLLSRKQMIIELFHPNKKGLSREQAAELVAKKFKISPKNVVTYGLKTQFGGGKTSGFAFIYDNHQYLLKYEPKNRLRKLKILPKKEATRKSNKELKKKIKKSWGKNIGNLRATSKKILPSEIKRLKKEYLKKAEALD